MSFINNDFLLKTKTAQRLYHEFAEHLPIIDYHNHLSPQQIAENYQFKNLTEIWLEGDHYKWRAMRSNGVPEKFITGESPDEEKFKKWAETVPYLIKNPLHHWTHLELKRYFEIDELLSSENADKIYKHCSDLLQKPTHSTQHLLKRMKVKVVCTTDDPCDDLKYHKAFKSDSLLKMLPAFRPDNALHIEKETFLAYIERLSNSSEIKIESFEELVNALKIRVEYFHNVGCRLSDHGLTNIPLATYNKEGAEVVFRKRIEGKKLSKTEVDQFKVTLLVELGKMYHQKGWVMQLHLGAIRNNNLKLLNLIGADVGCDSIGDYEQATGLSNFLNLLTLEDMLPKTILYNLNPRDNEVFATMAGNFNNDGGINKVQWGSAWWFLDQKDGIEKQLNALSNMGLLSRFVGMLTDSRSFLSFPRHEYFRRILCNLLGNDMENGELPNDIDWIGKIVQDICYYNAKEYFEFS